MYKIYIYIYIWIFKNDF